MTAAGMPWIKMWTETLDDPKLGMIDPATKWRFVELCLMAGESDSEGYIVNGDEAMTVETIAWRLRANPAEIGAAMEVLQGAGLLAQDPDGFWFVVNFEKRQGRSQSEKRKLWRERKRRQREKDIDGSETTGDIPEEQAESPEDVPRDSPVSPTMREEKRRERGEGEERESRGDNAGKPAPSPSSGTARASPGGKLTTGQRGFLDLFGAKRYKNNVQKDTILTLEKQYGTDNLLKAGTWAAKKGMSVSDAVCAVESALPKWGGGNSDGVIKVGG
jgi:hypothetical protein